MNEPGIDVIFDIETVTSDKSRQFVEEKVYDLPKNFLSPSDEPAFIKHMGDSDKKQAKYMAWQDEQREKIRRYVKTQQMRDLEKAALHWWQSKICSIAWAHVHEESGEIISRGVKAGPQEDMVIKLFFDAALNSPYRVARVIGKNSKNFDTPYLIGRCIALNLGLPPFLRSRISSFGDIDEIFGSLSARNSQITTLANYAFGLDITGKTGSALSVETFYRNQNFEAISDYNIHDVEIVYEMYRRYKKEYV